MTHPRMTAASAAAAFSAIMLVGTALPTLATPPLVPPVGPSRPLDLPKVVERTLPNGLRLVILEDHRQPAVWMRLALPAGSIRDPKDRVGLAAMAAGLLNKGTTTRTQEQIASTVDSLGATLGASADDDFLVVSANCLTPHAGTLADLMADITLRPAFAQPEIARYRTQAISSYRSSLAEGATLADLAAARLIYGAHPYGNFSLGTPETLPRITQSDLQQFHATYFAPNAGTLFLVGDITPAGAEALAKQAFGDWDKKEVPALPPPPRKPAGAGANGKPRVTIIDRPGSAQTEVRIATLSPGYSDPSRVPAQVATAVLGLGQFEGRLTQEIRVKRGLTYGASSYFDRKKQAGEFLISTFTKNASTGQVVDIALGEVNKLRQTPPPAAELADRKRFLTGSFAVSVASPAQLVSRLQTYTLLGGGPSDLEKYTQRVEAVTPQQIRQIINSIPVGAGQVVLVGDAKAIQSQLKGFGPVTVVKQDELDLLSPTLKGAAAAAPKAPAPTPEQSAAGRALLDAAIAAHGGEAFLNLKSLKATGSGELTPPGSPSAVPVDSLTLVTSAPDRVRLDMTLGAFGQVILAAPGGGQPGWVSFGGSVQNQPIPGTFGDPTAILRQARAASYSVQPLTTPASPSADGKALQGFAITDPNGRVTNVYAEADTHLMRRLEAKQGTTTAVVQLGGYKNVGGVQLPGQITLTANGQNVLALTLTDYTINPTVADAQFARPKE
jgi:zinc protease